MNSSRPSACASGPRNENSSATRVATVSKSPADRAVRYSLTTLVGVAVCSVVVAILPLLRFRFALECLEPRVPELLQELPQLGETIRPRQVQALGAVAPLAHEARL